MPTPKAIADRDQRLLELHDRLTAEWGRSPTRQEVADEAGDGVSRNQVQAAFARARQRGEKARDRAPGGGRPGKPPEPLLDVVVALCEQAIATTAEYEGLPVELTAAARKLRGRKGWQSRLRDREAEPPTPDQLELGLDVVAVIEEQIVRTKRNIEGAGTPAEERQHQDLLMKELEKLEKFRPQLERDGKREVDEAEMVAYAQAAKSKLHDYAARLREQRQELVAQVQNEAPEIMAEAIAQAGPPSPVTEIAMRIATRCAIMHVLRRLKCLPPKGTGG